MSSDGTTGGADRADGGVALVCMPLSKTNRPSLGLSILKAHLGRLDIPCDVLYLNLKYAERIGSALHGSLNDMPTVLLAGEWLFSGAVCTNPPDLDGFLASAFDLLQMRSPISPRPRIDGIASVLRSVLPSIEPFLEDCIGEVPWSRYRAVGFSLLFEQTMASLALAARLKALRPDLFTVFGGPNCEGVMGRALLDAYPFLDAVCSGEADRTFPALISAVLAGEPPPSMNGLLTSGGDEPPRSADPVADLDALPDPDFDDYFDQRLLTTLSDFEPPSMLVQGSRGCSWGEKCACTFCGLNGGTSRFRQQSPERAAKQMEHLLARYGRHSRSFHAVDNSIPADHLKGLLPRLARVEPRARLFYETRPVLHETELTALRSAGVDRIQPGIESLSTPVLELMRKGTTSLRNIETLRLCVQYGIRVAWNYLGGVPGEKREHYRGQPELIGAVFHLPPPGRPGVDLIRIDRFSRYQQDPRGFGIRELEPLPTYGFVHRDLAEQELRDVAYFFLDRGRQDGFPDYLLPVEEALVRWHEVHESAWLLSVPYGGGLAVGDYRDPERACVHLLDEKEAAVLTACNTVLAPQAIRFREPRLRKSSETEVAAILEGLLAARLALSEGGFCVSLVVPHASIDTVPVPVRQPFRDALQGTGPFPR